MSDERKTGDLFADDAAHARESKARAMVETARAEAAVLREGLATPGRIWESSSGKAVNRIKRWRRDAADLPEPHRTELLALADDLAGRLQMWFRKHV